MTEGIDVRTLKKLFSVLLKAFTHPIGVFVLLQIVWVAVLILWVVLFISQKDAAFQLAKTLGEKEIDPTYGIALLTIGCVLLGIILLGTVMLFVWTQKQASFLNQQKSFVSSVTHELRSPLASLQLSFETLKNRDVSEQTRAKLFEMIERDLNRQLMLIERILITSRLDRGVFELEPSKEPTPLKGLIEGVINQSGHLCDNLEARVTIICDDQLAAHVPKLGLNLILSNLLENAVKYSPSGSSITIEAAREAKRILIRVQDQGLGLSSKDLRKVFRMFYRANTASKKAIHGTGLGLFIVSSTVKLISGTIWAESDGPGKGTAFYVSLPLE